MGLDWMGAAGVVDRESGTPIRPDQPARLASTTKTYVAAAVLRLAEQGKLALDDAISSHLSKSLNGILQADGYRTGEITVRHLLTHTGGIADHLVDAFLNALVTDPMRDWSAEGIIAFMTGATDPLGPPGTRFLYSDGGYILLGDILRQATETSIGAAVRQLLRFEELGLQATWWEVMEPEPANVAPRVSQVLPRRRHQGLEPVLRPVRRRRTRGDDARCREVLRIPVRRQGFLRPGPRCGRC